MITYTIEMRQHGGPAWDWLELDVPEEQIAQRLQFWRELNDYAISERGESARKEFRATPSEV